MHTHRLHIRLCSYTWKHTKIAKNEIWWINSFKKIPFLCFVKKQSLTIGAEKTYNQTAIKNTRINSLPISGRIRPIQEINSNDVFVSTSVPQRHYVLYWPDSMATIYYTWGWSCSCKWQWVPSNSFNLRVPFSGKEQTIILMKGN